MEEHVDGFGSFFEALDEGLLVLELAHHFPHAELLTRFHELRSVIEDDEALDAEALHEDLGEAGQRGVLPGVAGNEAAENDAAVKVHAVENGLHDFATDILKVDVHAAGSGGD